MPMAVYVLGLAIFAQGTSELMLAGLLPQISSDLGVSIPDAGLLISAFAVGMLVGAPVLAAATLRWSRRTTMLTFLAIFVATHVLGATTGSYAVLLATRMVGAFVYAGFWAVAAVTVIALVPPSMRARAMGTLAAGLTVATVFGLPAGTFVGQHLGWQAAFWGVAGLTTLVATGVYAMVPHTTAAPAGGSSDDQAAPSLRREFVALVRPRMWTAYATTAVSIAGLMAVFGYLAPLLTEAAGLAETWVPVVLALYGVGSFVGITMGGRKADAKPFRVLVVGLVGMVVASVALAFTAHWMVAAVAFAVLLGGTGFAINPVLNSRAIALAADAPTLAAGMNVSSFNVGITLGPWLGGLAIGAGLDYQALGWLGGGLGLLALGVGWLGFHLYPHEPADLTEPPRSGDIPDVDDVRQAASVPS